MSAVVLINPKYPHNVGAAVRACACWGVDKLRWTGRRISLDGRLPREERMKDYRPIDFKKADKPFLEMKQLTPVCVELHPTSQNLIYFEHPEKAVYVFGPEDGSVPQAIRALCHHFVFIPTHHCLNLSAAVNVTLAHRRIQRTLLGLEPHYTIDDVLHERRGYIPTPAMDASGWDGH